MGMLLEICGIDFSRKKGLSSHNQSVHEERKYFNCPICYVIFKIRFVSMYKSERVKMTSEALNWIGNEVDS